MEIKTPHMKNNDNLTIVLKDEMCHTKLKLVQDAKYLGFHIDKNWKHTTHIDQLITKLRSIMPKLYQIRHILNLENKKGVYFAWVESHLRYGIELYGFTSEENINRLQKIQNKIIKILFKNNEAQPTNELYKELKILNIKGLRNYVVLLKIISTFLIVLIRQC